MRVKFLLAAMVLASPLIAAVPQAQASVVRGNDTSGIIPWSRTIEPYARQIATDHCGHYGKYPRITGVVRQYGNYISFNCLWRPGIARAALPAVGLVRQHCHRTWVREDGRRHPVTVCR
jgi:hypothetical protein